MASNTGDSFASASSASFLMARSGWSWGTRVSGDISISIDDCFLSSPRIVNGKVGSIPRLSIPPRAFFSTLLEGSHSGQADRGGLYARVEREPEDELRT